MSQQLLIVEMFIIKLVTRILYRRQYDPILDLDDDVEETKTVLTSKKAIDIAWEEQTVACDWDFVIYLRLVCWKQMNYDGH